MGFYATFMGFPVYIYIVSIGFFIIYCYVSSSRILKKIKIKIKIYFHIIKLDSITESES